MTNLSIKIDNTEILAKIAILREKGIDVRKIFEEAILNHQPQDEEVA